jgi:Icc-related predicted phosphoesterase
MITGIKQLNITAISDTHNLHSQVIIPETDILIHAGDATDDGTYEEEVNFLNLFNLQPAKIKLCIGGNHDSYLEENPNFIRENYPNIIYLDNEYIEIEGLKIYGSPSRPRTVEQYLHQRKHRKSSFKVLDRFECFVWPNIPSNIDILLTHIPSMGHNDIRKADGESLGSLYLYEEIINRVKPKVHIYGHNHDQNGISYEAGITFVNVAMCNRSNQIVNKPYIFTL